MPTTSPSADDRFDPDLAGPPLPLLTLLALLTVATLELVRSSGPLLNVAFNVGVTAAAGSALITYLAPGLLGLILIRLTRGANTPVLLVGALLLVAARLIVQALTADARFVAGLATIALAIAVLTFAIAVVAGRSGGGRPAAMAVASGAAAAVGIQLALGTWDAYWRNDPLGWGVTIVIMVGMVTCVVLLHRDPAAAPTMPVFGAWALGPALALMVTMLANPAFASSQSDVGLAVAGPTTGVGLLLAAVLVFVAERRQVSRRFLSHRSAKLALAAAPAAAVAGLLWATGAMALVLLVAAQLAVVAVIASAFEPGTRARPRAPSSPVRTAGNASVVGLGTILPLLVFNLDYDIPLGFPNELILVGTALLVGAAIVFRRRHEPIEDDAVARQGGHEPSARPNVALLIGTSALVLVGALIAARQAPSTTPRTDRTVGNGPITLVSWNLHFGVDSTGAVDLEQIARTIEVQDPSVVILQEVSRGWVMGGGADMTTWLADRIGMRVIAFAPAADRQFGNTILTSLPSENTTILALPYGQGPQNRSAVSTNLLVADGHVRVTSVHLQSENTTPTRLAQLDTLLRAEGDSAAMIIAGDFNAEPGWREIEQMTNTGLISAQDVAGDPSAPTRTDPQRRIDWVFGRGVTFTETKVLSDAQSSDHLPLVVTFTVSQD